MCVAQHAALFIFCAVTGAVFFIKRPYRSAFSNYMMFAGSIAFAVMIIGKLLTYAGFRNAGLALTYVALFIVCALIIARFIYDIAIRYFENKYWIHFGVVDSDEMLQNTSFEMKSTQGKLTLGMADAVAEILAQNEEQVVQIPLPEIEPADARKRTRPARRPSMKKSEYRMDDDYGASSPPLPALPRQEQDTSDEI